VALLSTLAMTGLAQTPNPKAITGNTSQENHTISIKQVTASGKIIPARFISNFTVASDCSVIFHNEGLDAGFRALDDARVIGDAIQGTTSEIPLVAGQTYQFTINATMMTIVNEGPFAFSAIIEYMED